MVAPPAAPTAQAEVGIYKVGRPYQVEATWYYPAEDYAYVQEGVASWYGADFNGKRTANGDLYDMNKLTAAHPTLPMPSLVKVTNLDNGRVLKVTVNDRGPFHSSRIIDLSRRAAQLLGFFEAGTARVRVEIDPEESINMKNLALSKFPPEMPQISAAPRAIVSALALAPLPPSSDSTTLPPAAVKSVAAPAPPNSGNTRETGIFIQAGAFSEEANARKLEQRLGDLGPVRIIPITINEKKLYRVQLGPVADPVAAMSLLGKVKAFGYGDAKVVRE